MEDEIESKMFHSLHTGPISTDVVPENDAVILSSSSATDSLSNPQIAEYLNETTISHFQDTGDVGRSILMSDSNLSSEQFFCLSEQSGPEMTRRNERHNMRKSLAWDDAFFTSEGFLDSDELSSMIRRDNKIGKHLLPEITEDICRSTDSISTLGSESLAMECIEADLMRDIRASIQKSSEVSDTTTGFKKIASALDKADTAPKDLVKIKSGTKKQSTSVAGHGRLTKKSPDCSKGTQVAPKVIGRRNPTTSASTERATSGGNQVKVGGLRENSSTVPGKVAPTIKTGLCSSKGTALKPPLCMKSSSLNSSVTSKKDPQKRCVSSDSSSGASSTNVGLSTRTTALKPPLCMKSSFSSSITSKKDPHKRSVSSDSSRGASTTNVGKSPAKPKVTPTRIVTPTSSCSMTKLPAKAYLKAKRPTSLSASSTSSVLSKISPGSSISDWSSEASSSATTVIRRTTDIRPPNKTRDNSVPLAVRRPKHSDDQILNRNEKKASQPSDGKVKAASSQVGMLSGSATTKPSGLRVPSPNMGYFDGAKSAVHTPKRTPRSFSVTSASPRNERVIRNISGSSSKTNSPSISAANFSSRKPASPITASKSASSIGKGTRSRLKVSSQVKSVESVENCLKEEEIIPISEKLDPKGSTDEIGNTGILEREMNLEKQGDTDLENAKIDYVEGDACSIRPICNMEHVKEIGFIRAKADTDGAEEIGNTGLFESEMNSHLKEVGSNPDPMKGEETMTENETKMQVLINLEDGEVQKWLSQTDLGHQECDDIKEGSLSNAYGFSHSSATLETGMGRTRTPLTVMNSLISNEGFDSPATMNSKAVKKTITFPSLETTHKESLLAAPFTTEDLRS